MEQDKIDQYKERIAWRAAKEKSRERKAVEEHPFGTIKMLMGKFIFFAKRGGKSQAEFDYYAATYNQKRLIGCAQTSDVMAKMGKSSQ